MFLVSIAIILICGANVHGVGVFDINIDQIVDLKDLAMIAQNFNTTANMKDWNSKCDVNSDSRVDIYDMVLMSKHLNESTTIVAFGDSITAGIGVPDGHKKWTDTIKERFVCNVINSGIGGNTSSQGLVRIKTDVLDHNPSIVIINFGMNDHYMIGDNVANVTLTVFKENLNSMVDQVKQINAIPILVTPNQIIEGDKGNGNMSGSASYYYKRHPANWYNAVGGANAQLKLYCDAIKEVAIENNVSFIDMNIESAKYDLYQFLRTLQNDVVDDGVHPHALGAEIYGKIIGDYLSTLFQ